MPPIPYIYLENPDPFYGLYYFYYMLIMICLKLCNVTKQPWFLDCHQLLLSMSGGIKILSWTSTLHKKKAFCIVKYYILKQNYMNWLKMKIAFDVYCKNKLLSHRKESVKWPYKPAFYAFMCLCITENQSLGIPKW